MSSLLDMSLDDLIRKSEEHGGRNSNYRGRGRGTGTGTGTSRDTGSGSVLGPGPDRRVARHEPTRPKPYSARPAQVMQVQQEPIMLAASGGYNGEAKLYVSNLDYGVSNEDIKVLFSEVGDLLRYSIHYDRSGRSKGTAEVVFARKTDALAAIKRYNNVQLDGKPLKIELVGVNIITPVPVPVTANLAKPNGAVRSVHERIGARGRGRGGGGSSSGVQEFARGQGQGRRHVEQLTAEALDSDLDKYRLEAMKLK